MGMTNTGWVWKGKPMEEKSVINLGKLLEDDLWRVFLLAVGMVFLGLWLCVSFGVALVLVGFILIIAAVAGWINRAVSE